jgi:hypothetical protein
MKLIPFGVLASGLLMMGCASKPSVMTVEQFDRLPVAEQEAVIADLEAKPARLERFKQAQLMAEAPVVFEYRGIGYKMHCIRYPGSDYAELSLYHGQDAPSLSRASHQALAVIAANGDCTVRLRDAGNGVMLPVTMRNDAGMSEGFFRALALRTTPAIMNGTGAVALRDALGPNCEGGRCGGPTFNVMGGVAQAASSSESNSEVNSDVGITGGCPSGDCGSVFRGLPTEREGDN